MSSDVTDIDKSTKVVHWKGWGRPNKGVEPGMQLVAQRSSVNIWHDITVIVSCGNGKPEFSISKFRQSAFPSLRVWKDGKQQIDSQQGSFADLWQGDSSAPTFVAP